MDEMQTKYLAVESNTKESRSSCTEVFLAKDVPNLKENIDTEGDFNKVALSKFTGEHRY